MKKITIFIALLTAGYVGVSRIRNASTKHALNRLMATGIVKKESDVEMLWSSGLLRENTSIYKCLMLDAVPPEFRSQPLTPDDEEVEEMFKVLQLVRIEKPQVDQIFKGAIDWKNARVWCLDSTKDGPDLLSMLFVIRTPNHVFLIFNVL